MMNFLRALISIPIYCYGIGSLLVFCAFLTNLSLRYPAWTKWCPYNIDGVGEPLIESPLFNNLLLLAIFMVLHTGMASSKFKNSALSPPCLRLVYDAQSAFCVHMLMKYWSAMPMEIWSMPQSLMSAGYTLYWCSVAFLWISFLAIDHFAIFGLREGFQMDFMTMLGFQQDTVIVRGPYAFIRNPIMTAWFLMFFTAPVMSQGHLLLSVLMTIYIVLAIRYSEEPRLLKAMGKPYERYVARVPRFFNFCPWRGGYQAEKPLRRSARLRKKRQQTPYKRTTSDKMVFTFLYIWQFLVSILQYLSSHDVCHFLFVLLVSLGINECRIWMKGLESSKLYCVSANQFRNENEDERYRGFG